MNKLTKYFNIIILSIIVLVFCYRFYDYRIKENYFIEVNAPCDISTEKCFQSDGTANNDAGPYKVVDILKKYAPDCLEEHSCQDFTCSVDSKYCTIRYCDVNTNKEGEKCVDSVSLNQ